MTVSMLAKAKSCPFWIEWRRRWEARKELPVKDSEVGARLLKLATGEALRSNRAFLLLRLLEVVDMVTSKRCKV